MNSDSPCPTEKPHSKDALFNGKDVENPVSPWPQKLRRGLVTLEQLDERGWLNESDTRELLEKAQDALDIRVPAAWHEPPHRVTRKASDSVRR